MKHEKDDLQWIIQSSMKSLARATVSKFFWTPYT